MICVFVCVSKIGQFAKSHTERRRTGDVAPVVAGICGRSLDVDFKFFVREADEGQAVELDRLLIVHPHETRVRSCRAKAMKTKWQQALRCSCYCRTVKTGGEGSRAQGRDLPRGGCRVASHASPLAVVTPCSSTPASTPTNVAPRSEIQVPPADRKSCSQNWRVRGSYQTCRHTWTGGESGTGVKHSGDGQPGRSYFCDRKTQPPGLPCPDPKT